MNSCLTFPGRQGQWAPTRYAYRAGRQNPVIVGADSADPMALFCARRSMAAGTGQPSGWPVLRPVSDPRVSPPPNAVRSIVADSSTKRRSPIMANATPTGEIRPQSAPSTASADTTSEVRLVKEATLIKRIRRKLAERGHSLLITREGTAQRRELGQYVVLGERHEVLSADCKLDSLARFLGVLAADETVCPPVKRGWRWYAGRHRVEVVDGIRFHYVDRLTADYTTEQALSAAMARTGIADATVVSYRPCAISFDGPISGQEGSHGAI